ncbi:MAG: HAD family hydrolase [Desulfobacteraceae bacterium]
MTKTRAELRKRIRGVLFDFDGTLTYPGALDFPAIKREINCPPDIPILEYLDTLPHEQRARLTKILEAKEEAAAEASFPNIGAERCLSALKQRGVLLGILTRNSMQAVRLALKKFEGSMLEDFAAIITREESLPKPHPDGVRQAATRMDISTSELMVVGDFRFDVMAGKAAGAVTVLLKNTDKSVMSAGDPKPDYTVSYLKEVVKIIDALQPTASLQ